jgi:hypothetical protein
MAKKDTYLALLRRGIDETTAETLADAGLKIGEIKELTLDQMVGNYGIKKSIAEGVIDAVQSGPRSSSKERFLAGVLSDDKVQKMDKIDKQRFKRKQKHVLQELQEQKERLRLARVEQFRSHKQVMTRLGKTIELIVKLETNFDDESKDEQKVKIRDQLETRGLEAARDHELLDLAGTPQDIVDFRRQIVPTITFHVCPACQEEIDPRAGNINLEDTNGFTFICWECEHEFTPLMAEIVETHLESNDKIEIDSDRPPRDTVFEPPQKATSQSLADLLKADLEATGATADEVVAAVEESNLTGGLMSIEEWIDQTLAAKGYIQAQEHREDFIISTGAGATKFNKWMKKAGLYFNKQTGRWCRWEDRGTKNSR